jgi:hypothetical protein
MMAIVSYFFGEDRMQSVEDCVQGVEECVWSACEVLVDQ